MEIEKHIEMVRPSVNTLWFYEYVKEHPEDFVDIHSYSYDTYFSSGDVIIDIDFSEDRLTQSKKIYFKNYAIYDQWQTDPTIKLIVEKQKQYDIENKIKMNFMVVKDIMTDIVFFKRENKD